MALYLALEKKETYFYFMLENIWRLFEVTKMSFEKWLYLMI